MSWEQAEAAERREVAAPEVSWALRDVNRMTAAVDRTTERLLGLSHTEAQALGLLMMSPSGLGPVELGNALGIRSASATALVDRLEAAGHAQRHPHPTDRRRQVVVTTDSSRRAAIGVLAPLLADIDALAAELSAEEAVVVERYLRGVAEAMRRYSSGGP
jgi:DNA-binding MarR family transcriptional regulator